MVNTIKKIFTRGNRTLVLTPGLPPGSEAPGFTLPATGDAPISLSQFTGQPVVLVFYPADATPVCSSQLALYNESLHLFDEYDAQLLAISINDLESHQSFSKELGLKFPLLSDDDPAGQVGREYGVLNPVDGKCDRALFVIDRQGKIRWRHVSPRGVNPGAGGILAALASLK
jgi:peroxiredoxin